MTTPILMTPRLHLRALSYDDVPALHDALSDEASMAYWSSAPKKTLKETREYMRFNIEAKAGPCWAITKREAPELALGWVILMIRKESVAEIGYITLPSARGEGLAFEACARVVEYGFSEGMRRIYADTDPDNTASIALLEKLGFRYEGRLVATWHTHLGIRDSAIYAKVQL
ncbi:GNAT family N-acetyltransferase [Woodsholea maritima]|uniref:GNAT family N-acetyltransferase n=1 Tax=Woodsholea maritima TaxID=240237 RepID=UPI000362C29E|nr:GNAT family N-acetyltransferase [Woodsholea maritima]